MTVGTYHFLIRGSADCELKNFVVVAPMPHTAYIVSAVRTPGGRKNGRLREWHPVSLGAAALDALVARSGIDGNLVVTGCDDHLVRTWDLSRRACTRTLQGHAAMACAVQSI